MKKIVIVKSFHPFKIKKKGVETEIGKGIYDG